MPEPKPLSQHQYLKAYIATHTTQTIECCICDASYSARDVSADAFAQYLFLGGWRHAISDKFKTARIMCWTCFKTPDADRGE